MRGSHGYTAPQHGLAENVEQRCRTYNTIAEESDVSDPYSGAQIVFHHESHCFARQANETCQCSLK